MRPRKNSRRKFRFGLKVLYSIYMTTVTDHAILRSKDQRSRSLADPGRPGAMPSNVQYFFCSAKHILEEIGQLLMLRKYKSFSFNQGFCPWTRWWVCPHSPVIDSLSALIMCGPKTLTLNPTVIKVSRPYKAQPTCAITDGRTDRPSSNLAV